jgi:hypothetical protein
MLVTHVNNAPEGRNVTSNVRDFWPISNGTLAPRSTGTALINSNQVIIEVQVEGHNASCSLGPSQLIVVSLPL